MTLQRLLWFYTLQQTTLNILISISLTLKITTHEYLNAYDPFYNMSLNFIYLPFSIDILYILHRGRYFNRRPFRRSIFARQAFELFLAKYLLECSCRIHSGANPIIGIVITVIPHGIYCDHFILLPQLTRVMFLECIPPI